MRVGDIWRTLADNNDPDKQNPYRDTNKYFSFFQKTARKVWQHDVKPNMWFTLHKIGGGICVKTQENPVFHFFTFILCENYRKVANEAGQTRFEHN